MTGTSPFANSAHGHWPVHGIVGLLVLGLVALCGSSELFGQDVSAFPNTPRPVRRLDSAAPIALSDAAAPPETLAGEVAKTPIRRLNDGESATAGQSRSQTTVWLVMGGIVAGAAGLSYWARSGGKVTAWKLPNTVFQVLGKASISPNQSVTLLRLGERVLLVSSSGPAMQTLAVVTDPAEVAAMTSECLSKRRVHLAETAPAHQRHVEGVPVAGTIAPEQRRRSVTTAVRGQDHA